MGNSRMTDRDWTTYQTYTTTTFAANKSVNESFTQRTIHELLDPTKITVRESRNSEANPQATPIILALDVTGSMGKIAKDIAANQFGVMMRAIFDRVPVTDPHIMFMGVGDVACDYAPLQVSQFEADIRIIEQLAMLFVEGGGGGNLTESYNLPWYFANFKTSCDAFEKDGRKGFLFTFGDEGAPDNLNKKALQQVFGVVQSNDLPALTNSQLIEQLEDKYHVFHLRIMQGASYYPKQGKEWTDLLGDNVLPVSEYRHLAEIIVSAMMIASGKPVQDVVHSWEDSSVRKTVAYAFQHMGEKSLATDTDSERTGQKDLF